MKIIILNASPRKNWNTAKLLKSAKEGAASNGAEIEYIDLYDLNFTGCRSCTKFNMGSFDENMKKYSNEKNFPNDLKNAYMVGKMLSE